MSVLRKMAIVMSEMTMNAYYWYVGGKSWSYRCYVYDATGAYIDGAWDMSKMAIEKWIRAKGYTAHWCSHEWEKPIAKVQA